MYLLVPRRPHVIEGVSGLLGASLVHCGACGHSAEWSCSPACKAAVPVSAFALRMGCVMVLAICTDCSVDHTCIRAWGIGFHIDVVHACRLFAGCMGCTLASDDAAFLLWDHGSTSLLMVFVAILVGLVGLVCVWRRTLNCGDGLLNCP